MAKRKRYEDYMLLASGESIPGHNTNYLVERVVGTGAFAAVYFARDPALPGRRVALKEFFAVRHPREQANLKALFDRERAVGIQASLHPLMPTFYEAFQHDGRYYIAQEFIEGATLDEIIFKRHPLPREWTLKWAVSLCDALAFLHSRQVVHHDLKPANIRITPQGHLTLLDFGAAQYFGDHESGPPVEMYGTEGYLPPELEADGRWVADVRTDIFALGCILYEMIAGVAPDQESINERSMYVTSSLIQRPNADLGLVKLINKALSYNTEYRYASANDFLLEMRKIAPPLLLVSRKHLRWGQVSSGQAAQPQTFTVYNAGGGSIRGEIKPRASWISVPQPTFQGNSREVAVSINTARIPERDQLVTGRLEINTPDVLDAEGQILSSGDRWFIECNVTIEARPASLQVKERLLPNAPPIPLSARKGQMALGTFTLINIGEQEAEFRLERGDTRSTHPDNPLPDMILEPLSGRIAGGKSTVISINVATGNIPSGTLASAATVRTATGQTIHVPISLRVLSSIDFLKTKMGLRTN